MYSCITIHLIPRIDLPTPQFIMIYLLITSTFSCSKCMKICVWVSVYSGERFARYNIILFLYTYVVQIMLTSQ